MEPRPDLRDRLAAFGQDGVLRYWDELDAAGRERLLAQLAGVDLAALARDFAAARAALDGANEPVEPVPVVRLAECGGDAAQRREARQRGEALLAEGRVAALVVAGGQGTRLGHAGPKGSYPLGPVTERSLFALQAQKLRGLQRRYGVCPPWLVMTSPSTDAATRAFFARHADFGLPRERLFFLTQRELPVLDPDGRLLLAAPDRLATAPDGHGGALAALARSGAFGFLAEHGASALFSAQVDNPLVRIADPLLLGVHAGEAAEMTLKVVARRDPDERVGTLARERGGARRWRVIEYTELVEPERSLRTDDGALRFWAGSIGIHAFDTAFLARLAPDADRVLPVHASPKRVALPGARDARGAAANAFKLERFLFDLLPHARRAAAAEARREDEYAPLKNATGGESVATARHALSALGRRWLAEARVAGVPEAGWIELDHAKIDAVDDVRSRSWRDLCEAGDARHRTRGEDE